MPNNKKQTFSKKGKKKAAAEQPISEQELHRFAGSSDEEESGDEYNQDVINEEDDSSQDSKDADSGDEAVEMKAPSRTSKTQHSKNKKETAKKDEGAFADKDENSDENHSDDDDDSEDDDDADFDHYENQQRQKNGPAGMASAMAKILGDSAPTLQSPKHKKQKTASGSAVLSKTVTPLQRQLQKEKELAKAMRLKRREKAINPLPALHIPLSVATTSITLGDNKPMSVTHELEQERSHRRVATRGVVALFNAVAQHQKKGPASGEATATSASKKSTEQVKKMTKHGFLDMIKTAAVGGKNNDTSSGKGGSGGDASSEPKASTSKWAAMQDDYMLNPKKVRFIMLSSFISNRKI